MIAVLVKTAHNWTRLFPFGCTRCAACSMALLVFRRRLYIFAFYPDPPFGSSGMMRQPGDGQTVGIGSLLCSLLYTNVVLLTQWPVLSLSFLINSRPSRFKHLNRDIPIPEWYPCREHRKGNLYNVR